MNKEMLCEKLKNRFKDLVALVEQELGEEQMKAIMKIIYLNGESDIEDIVYDNKFYYHCDEYDFKPFSKQDFIDAYLVLFKGDEREAKNEVLDAYTEGFLFDDEKELKDALSYVYFNEITAKKYLSKQMAKKYYQYFTIYYIEKFLAE